MRPDQLYPIIAVLSLLGVEFGGCALLALILNQKLPPARQRFFRAGHTHAGVLLVLSLGTRLERSSSLPHSSSSPSG